MTRRGFQRQVEALAMENIVERERSRIAKDIHDDLGASLTQISLLSEIGKSELDHVDQAREYFDKIAEKSRSVVQALDEIVWAVNPRNDNLVRFAQYLCQFAEIGRAHV